MNNKDGGTTMKRKIWIISLMALLIIFATLPSASAHVTVHPNESSTDAWEKYSVRIPVEKDIHTTEVELRIPKGINFVNVMPVDHWDYKLAKDENENITSVTWTATGDGIGPNEFIEFFFVASNPSEPGEFSWEALQTYEDDSVVEWTGEPDADEPASVTKVVEGDAVTQHGNNETSNSDDVAQGDATTDKNTTSGGNNWLAITLSAIAILLALISLFRKRTYPHQ